MVERAGSEHIEAEGQSLPTVSTHTDDKGHFRVAGLLPGKYVVHTQPVSGMTAIAYASRGGNGTVEDQTIDLADEEDYEGADIEIPLNSLAEVDGVLEGNSGGRTVANVAVSLKPEDRESASEVTVSSSSDGTFQFVGVPEGDYKLLVNGTSLSLHVPLSGVKNLRVPVAP